MAMQQFSYFDNAATTKMSEACLETYVKTAEEYMANPSASYAPARESRQVLEESRMTAARVLDVKPSQLFFTSGATESISIVLSSLLWAKVPGRVIFSSIEHEAVSSFSSVLREKGWDVVFLGARDGFVSIDELERLITRETRLVAIMSVSNVLGTIQDIRGAVSLVRAKEAEYGRRIFFFTDSVQALGKTCIDLAGWDGDGASFSAHKIHGPRGCGLLYLKKGSIQSLAHAGGQEHGVRGGTENLPAIAAFAQALKDLKSDDERHIGMLNNLLRSLLEHSRVKVLTPGTNSVPHIIALSTPLPSEVALRMLQDRGFIISSGSACSNNARGKAESVYRSAGFAQEAKGALRVSFSRNNTLQETAGLAQALKEVAENG